MNENNEKQQQQKTFIDHTDILQNEWHKIMYSIDL
jgi:hypothetical protein